MRHFVVGTLLATGLLNMTSRAHAGQTSAGFISDVQTVADNRALFHVDGTHSNKPGCAVWMRYVIDISTPGGQGMLAQVLSAQAARRRVQVDGKGVCDLIAQHETTWAVRDAP